jgi:DNA-binding IclR family transcriptional regulator
VFYNVEHGGGIMKEIKLIQSLSRAAEIMQYVSQNGNNSGLIEISKGIGLSKSTVHGLISTLVFLGYMQQDQDSGKYKLGLKLFEMGQVVHDSIDIRTVSLPYLKKLVRDCEETAHLSILSGTDVIYIEKVDSHRSVRIMSRVGGCNPAYCTGVGKVLLANLSLAEIEQYLKTVPLVRFTPRTITDAEMLRNHLKQIREQGYAFDLEEFEQELSCTAAPIKNHLGTVVASISISGPSVRLTNSKLEELVKAVISTAQAISRDIGYKL